jgi:hypothetical protein
MKFDSTLRSGESKGVMYLSPKSTESYQAKITHVGYGAHEHETNASKQQWSPSTNSIREILVGTGNERSFSPDPQRASTEECSESPCGSIGGKIKDIDNRLNKLFDKMNHKLDATLAGKKSTPRVIELKPVDSSIANISPSARLALRQAVNQSLADVPISIGRDKTYLSPAVKISTLKHTIEGSAEVHAKHDEVRVLQQELM